MSNSGAVSSPAKIPKPFLKPRYDGLSIANIPETVAKFLNVKYGRTIDSADLSGYSDSENIVLLLLDGFGSVQLQFARDHYGVPSYEQVFSKADVIPLTSVFPSTTSSAMSSLHTGLTPQEHGVIGYTMFIPQLGAIVQMLRFAPVLGGRPVFDSVFEPGSFLETKTIHERLGEAGVPSFVYTPNHIIDSGLSKITYRGAKVEPGFSFADSVVRLRKNLESGNSNSFHFLYYASPDTVSHARGPYGEVFAAELDSIFTTLFKHLFSKLDRNIAKKTTLLVSGDHGAVRVKSESILDVADHPKLSSNFRIPPTGDSRASILNIRPETRDKIVSFFQENYPGQFEIMESSKMLADGYFGMGKPREDLEERIGDLVVLPKFDNALDNSQFDYRKEEIPGRHGGLTEEEMQVPLIVRKLAE